MIRRHLATSLLALPALLLTQVSSAQRGGRGIVPPLQNLTFQEDSFESKALDQEVSYAVFLPKDYAKKDNDKTYPLVIYLHGMFEDHLRFGVRGGAEVLDKLTGDCDIPEMIFVCANGGRRSFYINTKRQGYEDMITQDLLTHVNKTYRVKEGRDHRAILGVSMGGYGALKIALKHPKLFGMVGAHSAALLPRDSSTLDEAFPWLKRWGGGQRALGTIFGNPIDAKKYASENVLDIVDDIKGKDLAGLKLYIDCGDKDHYGFQTPNLELHQVLKKKKIKHAWTLVEGGDHGWRTSYNQDALPNSLRFLAAGFSGNRAKLGLSGLLGGEKREKEQPKKGSDKK